MKKQSVTLKLAVLFSMIFSLLLIAGCGSKASKTSSDASDKITLEWWYQGNGIQKDTKLVENAANKQIAKISGLKNVKVHLNCYPANEYKNAVSLAQAAGKKIDILNTVRLDFAQEVEKGTYLVDTEYL